MVLLIESPLDKSSFAPVYQGTTPSVSAEKHSGEIGIIYRGLIVSLTPKEAANLARGILRELANWRQWRDWTKRRGGRQR